MVRLDILVSNKYSKKWCCAAETPTEVRRCKLHIVLDSNSPHFALCVKKPSIHELRNFGCDI